MKKNKIIYAHGVLGGGLVILEDFLKKLNTSEFKIIKNHHLRIDKKYDKNVVNFGKGFIDKIKSEYYLKKISNKRTEIYYLNGIPPLFKTSGKTIVIFQNANILPSYFKNNLLCKVFSSNFIRMIKFIFFKKHVDQWIVYSNFSKKILQNYINNNIKVNKVEINFPNKKSTKIYDLIYPASGHHHKNHINLLEALKILSKKKIFPKLLLTLNKNEYYNLNIDNYIKKYKLKIHNRYFKKRSTFLLNYSKSKFLIYPSLSETLGLPLLEAKYIKLKTLTSNLPFAKEFVLKKNCFNPIDPYSIADCIEKNLDNEKK